MSAYFSLPDPGDHSLHEVIRDLTDRGVLERNLASVEWFINHYYLQGVRNFEIYSWREGDVRIPYENRQGELEWTYEALLYQYRVEMGRLMKLNLSPEVKREGFGLDSVRNSGISQAILLYMDGRGGKVSSKKLLGRLVSTLLKYGLAGLNHYRVKGSDVAQRTAVEVVPPWELLCIPAEIDTLDDIRGVVRHRKVPLSWIKKMGLDLGSDEKELRVTDLPYGEQPTTQGPEAYGESGRGGVGGDAYSQTKTQERRNVDFSRAQEQGTKRKGYKKSSQQQWVEMDEVYIYGPKGEVLRYIVKVGDVIAKDDLFEGKERVACPLSLMRYINTGRFYGRSYVGTMIGLNFENEKMLSNSFQNVTDMDNYPMVVIPTTSGISKRQLQKRERRKFLFAEPDPVTPNSKIYNVAPATNGDFPAKIAAMGIELQDKWGGQGELLSGGAPGRVDSAAGLGFLYETGNINLVATVNDLADGYVQIYESMLQAAKKEWEREGSKSFSLPVIDDRMIGVVLDAQSGKVVLEDNPVPNPWDVDIDVAERALRSPEQAKQEAMGMLQQGILSPSEFRILNEKEGWGFPLLDRTDWEAYRKAVVMKILLFNDGETPGEVIGGESSDRPEIMLQVLQELMGSVEFMAASQAVREAFIQLKQIYEGLLGQFPDQLPQPAGAGLGGPVEEQQAKAQMQGAG